jgi:D-amino-acid dehydrogenase
VNKNKKIIIIGAGIMGISSALNLIKRGYQVTIIEKEINGEPASFGNASWLSGPSITPVLTPGSIYKIPKMLFSKDGPLFLRFPGVIKILPWLFKYLTYSTKSKTEYISKHIAPLLANSVVEHKKLAKDTDAIKWIKDSPYLYLYKHKEDFVKDSFVWNIRKEYGFNLIEIQSEELRHLVPGLSKEYKYAIKIENQGYITNSKNYLKDLLEGFIKLGGKVIEDNVIDITSSEKEIKVKTLKKEISSDGVVIAAGIFSDTLSKKFGANVPLQSERGYHLELNETNIKLEYPLFNGYLKLAIAPRPNGIRFAGLVEFGSLKSKPNKKAYDLLMRNAKSMFPEITFKNKSEWTGHRPATVDSLPLIGQSSMDEKVFFAYGHHHMGLSAGPKTGEIISKLISRDNDQSDLNAYNPSRFNSSKG